MLSKDEVGQTGYEGIEFYSINLIVNRLPVTLDIGCCQSRLV